MRKQRQDQTIGRLLDAAIAHPGRLRALQSALRARSAILGMGNAKTVPAPAATGFPVSAEPYDDSLWDNMPV